MRHLHYFDPNLVDLSGHYFNYCAQAVREVRRRGISVSIYGRKNCQVTCEGIRPEPVFSHDIFAEVGRDPQVWAIENFNAVNQAFAVDLSRVNTDRFAAEDLLFFPTLNQNQLYAIAQWLARIPVERRPAVAVLFRYLTPAMDYNKARQNGEMLAHFYRFGALALTKVQPRTVFCADTREMADAFSGMLGRPVVEVSVAMEPPSSESLEPRRRLERPVVVYQGHMSQLKGFHLLPETILGCAKQMSPRPHFVVQVQSRAQTKLLPVVQWLERQPREDVRLVEGAVSADVYFELMQQADVVLLPYSLSYYGHCSSGVFAEAAALGKVIVVPEGTVAARQAREFDLGVVAAKTWNGAGLADAIAEAVRRWDELQGKALTGAERFRRAQSVGAFWESLLAALRTDVAAAA